MYLDFEDHRPDTPRIPRAVSVREAVLASLLVHALAVIAFLVWPEASPVEAQAQLAELPDRPAIEYVNIMPAFERPRPPRPDAPASDLDRRAASPARAADADNSSPLSAGTTAERVVGAREEKLAGPETPTPAPPAAPTTSGSGMGAAPADSPPGPAAQPPQAPPGGSLGKSLRNLSRYLQDENFDNQRGGLGDQEPAIQFDSKGIDFGPWLRRFVAQVKRNWYVPQSAWLQSGHAVIQFYIHRDGRITDIKIVKPSTIEPYNTSAFNALRMTSPTLPLPQGYPDDKVLFTVTFFYDVRLDQ